LAGQLTQAQARPGRQAAWSRNARPTLADAMAVVRQH